MAQTEYVDWFPPLGQFGGPVQPWPLAAGVDPLNLGAHRGKDLLLIAEPTDPASGPSLGVFGPLGDPVYPDSGEWGWKGTRLTLYPAATTPRSSDNNDTPAATYVPGALPAAPNMGSSIFDGIDPASRSRPTVGEIELIDPGGDLDYLLRYVWDGAPLTLKRGTRGTPFSTWDVVARYTAAGILPDLDAKRISLRDLGWQLQGLLHADYYGGTGGLDGDPSLAGRWKPWALGYCNAEPVLINAAAQIFQWSLTASAALTELRHGGVVLPVHADYPTFEALESASIPSGYHGTCLAHSLVRPNVGLQYGIRLDVIGDNEVAYGHPGPTTRAAIARRIATTRGPNRLDDAAQIDITAFNRLETRNAAPVGWYFSDVISKAEALDIVMGGILGWWRIRPDGRLTIGRVETPRIGSTLAIEYKAEGMTKPRKVAGGPPRAGTNMSWRSNAAPEARNALATSVDETSAAIYGQAARYVPALSPHVVTLYPTAKVVYVANSGFWNEDDAGVEANRQQGILSIERSRWQWEMQVDPFVDMIGTVATLNNFNRLEVGAAASLLCVRMDTPGLAETTFDWWG